jgi:hypothetical protein
MHMPAAATGCNCSTWQLVHQQQPQQRNSQPRVLPMLRSVTSSVTHKHARAVPAASADAVDGTQHTPPVPASLPAHACSCSACGLAHSTAHKAPCAAAASMTLQLVTSESQQRAVV